MNSTSCPSRLIRRHLFLALCLGGLCLTFLPPSRVCAADSVKQVENAVRDAEKSAARSMDTLWSRIEESRLKNRTADEIVAWVIMGVLAGALAGLMTPLKCSGSGILARLGLGLAGAFVGGMIVRVARVDFGLGPVLIRYEELLFSLAGAVLLLGLVHLVWKRMHQKSGN